MLSGQVSVLILMGSIVKQNAIVHSGILRKPSRLPLAPHWRDTGMKDATAICDIFAAQNGQHMVYANKRKTKCVTVFATHTSQCIRVFQ